MMIVPLLAAVYLLLAWLLLVAEKGGDGNINTWSDALWYTFVTMTTVGYGDMYPVTPSGRVIGFIFIMMSMGALAALFFFIVRVVLSEALIYLQIRLVKNKPWPTGKLFPEEKGFVQRRGLCRSQRSCRL